MFDDHWVKRAVELDSISRYEFAKKWFIIGRHHSAKPIPTPPSTCNTCKLRAACILRIGTIKALEEFQRDTNGDNPSHIDYQHIQSGLAGSCGCYNGD